MNDTQRSLRHLSEDEIAAYLGGDGSLRNQVQAHLAVCDECRQEMREVRRILRSRPSVRHLPLRAAWIPALAAAALVMFAVWPRGDSMLVTRGEGTVTNIISPLPLAPMGRAQSVQALRWSSVPLAQDYRVRVFETDGEVVWQTETADTTAALPDSVILRAGVIYYWNVEARTGLDRSVSSDLVQFTIAPRARR